MVESVWIIISSISSLITALAAVGAGIYAVYQYKQESLRQKEATRSKILADYNWHFMQNKSIQNVINALIEDKYDKVSIYDIEIFFRFYEEIYILIHSNNRMKPEIAKYMFAYYAIAAWENESILKVLNDSMHDSCQSVKVSEHWSIFRMFVKEMKAIKSNTNSLSI